MHIHLSEHFTYPKLLRFTFPTIVMMIFTSIYGVVDGVFVSNYAGKTAFAAVNLIMPALMIFATVGFMLGTGGSAVVARAMGEGDLPLIPGDPERLKQVFCNVLDNAAKHGGAGRRITASVTREGEWQVVRIRDFGPGIPEAELPFVKQKFYKGTSKARGSGIGLAVCDEIVGLHGGDFTIANAAGGGTVVTIRLPGPQ